MGKAEEANDLGGGEEPTTTTMTVNDGSGDIDGESIEEPEKGNATPSSSTSSSSVEESSPTRCQALWRRIVALYWEQEFLILILLSIALARAYPPLGAIYVAPDITASWIAVILSFLLAGLSLRTSEFSNALKNVKFNLFVQIFNFGVVSSLVFGLAKLLVLGHVLGENLAKGMIIAATLPMTINTVLVMTKAAGGDEAAAIFNAAFGNLIGVFLSPALILGYLGVSGGVKVADVFYKLAARVLLPIVVGQVLQYSSATVREFMAKHKPFNRQLQQYSLVFIVYTVFAQQFMQASQTGVGSVFIMIAIVFLVLIAIMALSWYSLKLIFPNEPKLRVMGLFGCTHKTIAMGLPLISTIYGGHSNVGLYSLPLLCWHPIQLLVGSSITPKLLAFVESEEARLAVGAKGIVESSPSPATDTIQAAEEGRASEPTIVPVTSVAVASTLMKGSIDSLDVSRRLDEDGTDSSR